VVAVYYRTLDQADHGIDRTLDSIRLTVVVVVVVLVLVLVVHIRKLTTGLLCQYALDE